MGILHRFTRFHKWLALLVGLQLLAWVVSGLVFSFINHREVGGKFIYQKQMLKDKTIQQSLNFLAAHKKYPRATEISQILLQGKSVFKIQTTKSVFIVDQQLQDKIKIDRELTEKLANRFYRGGGELESINLIEHATDENRGMKLPIWQVVYRDRYATHLYFSSYSGEYRGVRTDNWRIYDFFMMLHFMDYFDRGNFNSGLLIFAALSFLFFSISGMLLVYSSFSLKDFIYIINHLSQNKKISVTLSDENGGTRKIKVDKDERLMDALAENNIELNSVCGGGGICGGCRVKILSNIDESEDLSEHDTLDENELKEGYRLACQLFVESAIDIEISVEVK